MRQMHLRQPGFTCNVCWPFTKNKKRIQKFQETGDLWYIDQNKLDKSCFQYHVAHGGFKKLTRRTYCLIKLLILLKIGNMKDTKGVLL